MPAMAGAATRAGRRRSTPTDAGARWGADRPQRSLSLRFGQEVQALPRARLSAKAGERRRVVAASARRLRMSRRPDEFFGRAARSAACGFAVDLPRVRIGPRLLPSRWLVGERRLCCSGRVKKQNNGGDMGATLPADPASGMAMIAPDLDGAAPGGRAMSGGVAALLARAGPQARPLRRRVRDAGHRPHPQVGRLRLRVLRHGALRLLASRR